MKRNYVVRSLLMEQGCPRDLAIEVAKVYNETKSRRVEMIRLGAKYLDSYSEEGRIIHVFSWKGKTFEFRTKILERFENYQDGFLRGVQYILTNTNEDL